MLQGEATSTNVVVDSVKIREQIDAIRDSYGPSVTHVHMTAPLAVLTSRYESRESSPSQEERLSYQDVRLNETESLVDGLSEIADVVIDSDRCTEEDVLVRVASHLRLYGEESAGWADVVVGGQYGSEGKGQIAAYLASDYDLLVRVGGPNAGHKVFERPGSVYSSSTSIGYQEDCPTSPIDRSRRCSERRRPDERDLGMQYRCHSPEDRPWSDGHCRRGHRD